MEYFTNDQIKNLHGLAMLARRIWNDVREFTEMITAVKARYKQMDGGELLELTVKLYHEINDSLGYLRKPCEHNLSPAPRGCNSCILKSKLKACTGNMSDAVTRNEVKGWFRRRKTETPREREIGSLNKIWRSTDELYKLISEFHISPHMTETEFLNKLESVLEDISSNILSFYYHDLKLHSLESVMKERESEQGMPTAELSKK